MKLGLYLSVVLVGTLLAGEAQAAAGRDVEVDYYAEAALKTHVGTFTKPCGTGAAHRDGVRTPFYVRSSSSCQSASHLPPSTISCHFTEPGCSDDIARKIFKKPRKSPKSSTKASHA